MSSKMNAAKASGNKKNPTETGTLEGLHKQLYKTKFCMYHLQGACRFGTKCSFAHAISEMNSTPDLRKTQLCKDFAKGNCEDPNCNFAHTDSELRSADACFKKALCIWNEKGKCRNGAQCRFAHGAKELCAEPTVIPSRVGMGLGAEDLSKQGQETKSKKSASSHKSKQSGSTCSSISYQSTTSGSSGRPSGSGEGTPGSCSISRMTSLQSEPMKVGLFDSNLQNESNSLPAKEPPQLRLARKLAEQVVESAGGFEHELREGTVSQLSTLVVEALAAPKALVASQEDSLQMELDVLRKSVFLLRSHCNQLEERATLGGNPGVLGNMDAKSFIQSHASAFDSQLLPQASFNSLDGSIIGRNLESAYFAQMFGAAGGVF